MKRNHTLRMASIALALVLTAGSGTAFAALEGAESTAETAVVPAVRTEDFQQMGRMGMNNSAATFAEEPTEIIASDVVNSAAELEANTENAQTITMDEENNRVTIDTAGTYVITGSCSDGNIKVKKETTGVVLILQDLDLTSTTGAAISCNKGSEVQIVIQGDVTLTDAENPEDENSADTETADAFDGAALKVKAGASVYLTGDGNLTIDASACKNGIKTSDADSDYDAAVLTIGGELSIDITAANDAINAGYDLVIESGTLTVSAGDDAIHADRILQLGSEGEGPVITIEKSAEALEATVVNIFGGDVTVNANDDAINAANKNGTYSSELTYSINITGGTVNVNSRGDGLDSNGNINITGGFTTISSANNGGEAGIDYMGSCYVAEDTLQNNSGVSFDSGMGGFGGGRNGFGNFGGEQGGKQPMGNWGGRQNGTMPEGSMPEEGQEGSQDGSGNQMPGFGGQNGTKPGFPGGDASGQGFHGRHSINAEGQFPQNGQIPAEGQFPGNGEFPQNGQAPAEGQFPGNGELPQNDQMPAEDGSSDSGELPQNGQMPAAGQFPGSGELPQNGQAPAFGQDTPQNLQEGSEGQASQTPGQGI